MTELGARVADGFVLGWIHRDLLGDHVAALRAASSGRDRPMTLVWSTLPVVDEAGFRLARESLTFRLVDSPEEVRDLIGMTADDTAAIREALRSGGPPAAGHLVREEWVERFVVMGDRRSVGAEVRSTMDRLGIDEFQVPAVDDLGDVLDLLVPALT